MQVTEEFLKQLGSRPLAAALGDLDKLLAAAAADGTPATANPATAAASLAAGIALQPEATDSLARLGQLLSEIQVADAVMKLDLGPDVTKTLDMLSGVLSACCWVFFGGEGQTLGHAVMYVFPACVYLLGFWREEEGTLGFCAQRV